MVELTGKSIQRRAEKESIVLSRINDMPLWVEPRFRNMWRRLEQVTFAAFIGSLVTLLVVPIVGY